MPRERECFREQLQALQQRFEGAEVISMPSPMVSVNTSSVPSKIAL